MEATVTLKATPAELDLIREALEEHQETTLAQSNDLPASRERQELRTRVVQLDELIKKLR